MTVLSILLTVVWYLFLVTIALVVMHAMFHLKSYLNLKKLEKQGIPVLYFPYKGQQRLFDVPEDSDDDLSEFKKMNEKYHSVGLYAINQAESTQPQVMLISPEYKKEFFNKETEYLKKVVEASYAEGAGFFFAHGQDGLAQRAIFSDIFKYPTVAASVPKMFNIIQEEFKKHMPKNKNRFKRFDMEKALEKVIGRIGSDILFGQELPVHDGLSTPSFAKMTEELDEKITGNLLSKLTLGYSFYLPFLCPPQRQYHQNYERIENAFLEIYQNKMKLLKTQGVKSKDIEGTTTLDSCIKHNIKMEEDGTPKLKIPDDEIGENIMDIQEAGYSTTYALMLSCMQVLAENPKWKKKLEEEVYTVILQRGRKSISELTMEDLEKSSLLERVIKETLRFRGPSQGGFPREVMKTMKIGPYIFPKGTKLLVDLNDNHKKNFYAPFTFDPDRYLPERVKEINPMHDLPFYSGRRACTGRTLAIAQTQCMLICLLNEYVFHRDPNDDEAYWEYSTAYMPEDNTYLVKRKA